jgi:hypothetical protein
MNIKMNEMKTSNIFYTVFLILVCGCTQYPAYEVTNLPFVNKTSLNMYVGDEVQLTASPVGENFVWSSENEKVASVTQTGLVKAISEGLSSIIVKSANDEVRVDVIVRIFIHLTDINLSAISLKIFAGEATQIWAYSIPENASEVTFEWRSENPAVATVDKHGIVTAVSRGKTNIIVSSNSIEKIIPVNVPEVYKCDKRDWSVEVSDETPSYGVSKDKMIDNNYNPGEYWHSQWDGGAVPPPHWAIIDMKEPVEIVKIVTQRGGDTRTLQYFVGDSSDANADTWVKIAEGIYDSPSADHTLTLEIAEPATGRYLKLVLPDSFRYPYTSICEVDVYGLSY